MSRSRRPPAFSEKQSEILRLLATDTPIDQVLAATCRAIEHEISGIRTSILRCAPDGSHLHGGVAPSMSAGYIAALEGFRVGPHSGCCGAAVFKAKRVIVDDVTTDPLWEGLGVLARDNDIRACWSQPVSTTQGDVIGTFAIYRSTPGRPDKAEFAVVEAFSDLVSLALQKERHRKARIESSQRLSTLMQNIPGMVLQWSWPASGRIALTYVSEGIADMAGIDAETVLRHPRQLLRRVPPDERKPMFATLRESVRNLSPVRWDLSIRQNDGTSKWVRLVSRSTMDESGNVLNDALGLDITDRREAELRLQESRVELNDRLIELERTKARLETQSQSLMQSARELTAARDMAEEASRAKSNFLSNMSHELRTPLNAIIGFSDIIRNQTFGTVGNPKYRNYANDINASGRHLLELINEILDYAKVESGRDSLFEEEFRIGEVVEGVRRMVDDGAQRAGVTLSVLVPDDLPRIRADKRKLRQILINLLSNAIKFTPQGGQVTLTVWHRPESGFVFQVIDTGIGMELADIPKALGVFGQIDNAFSRSREGTGLGLPLTKALCELHGGSLGLQSQIGTGTTVTVRFSPERVAAAPKQESGDTIEDEVLHRAKAV